MVKNNGFRSYRKDRIFLPGLPYISEHRRFSTRVVVPIAPLKNVQEFEDLQVSQLIPFAFLKIWDIIE
jgi:hypothetical protein